MARGLLEGVDAQLENPFPDHVLTPVDKRIQEYVLSRFDQFHRSPFKHQHILRVVPSRGIRPSQSTTATVTTACTKKPVRSSFGTTTPSSRQTTIATTTPAIGALILSRNRAAPPATHRQSDGVRRRQRRGDVGSPEETMRLPAEGRISAAACGPRRRSGLRPLVPEAKRGLLGPPGLVRPPHGKLTTAAPSSQIPKPVIAEAIRTFVAISSRERAFK